MQEELKLASELTVKDIGRRIKGYHGARGIVSGKPAPTLNTIDAIKFERSGVTVTVYRSRYEKHDTFYSLNEQVKLVYRG